ncbi:hypothetical protein NHQ30_011665 [Ciborinia camelliae]|nr:hypothetical protein NHQ30_011665 [Ciborinia camelliae]
MSVEGINPIQALLSWDEWEWNTDNCQWERFRFQNDPRRVIGFQYFTSPDKVSAEGASINPQQLSLSWSKWETTYPHHWKRFRDGPNGMLEMQYFVASHVEMVAKEAINHSRPSSSWNLNTNNHRLERFRKGPNGMIQLQYSSPAG